MTGPPPIEPALVRAAQRGDRIAVADLMDALTPYVGRVCGPIALQEGPDAAQEALIAILRNLGGLREPGAIYGWARAIAVREAVRVARQAARAVLAELADVPAPGAEVTRFFDGLDLVEPGMVRVQQWRPDTEAERTSPAALWDGVARKP